jgi:hypothetical protein
MIFTRGGSGRPANFPDLCPASRRAFSFLEVSVTMYTIETTYHLPVYRQHSYEASSLEEACRLAVEDDDWSDQKEDSDSARETYVSGAWPGSDNAYKVSPLIVPAEFGETVQRKAEHFETLLGMLKILAHAPEDGRTDLTYWRERADGAIAKAEAIIARLPDP